MLGFVQSLENLEHTINLTNSDKLRNNYSFPLSPLPFPQKVPATMPQTKTNLTLEEFLALPDDNVACELIDGQAIPIS